MGGRVGECGGGGGGGGGGGIRGGVGVGGEVGAAVIREMREVKKCMEVQ